MVVAFWYAVRVYLVDLSVGSLLLVFVGYWFGWVVLVLRFAVAFVVWW